jgi:biofilm PGA synthesis N-glycosyltransferase PgaC
LLLTINKRWKEEDSIPDVPPMDLKLALLIPYRNESRLLPELLDNLEKVIPETVEVLFINDKSEDESPCILLASLQERNVHNWRLLENLGVGKKAALSTGVLSTEAEIILTTDADCTLPDHWPQLISRSFRHDHVQMVAGPVMTESGSGFFAQFQQIEWASILLMTQYLFSTGSPLMCSGANMAYRKSAFIAVGGYEGNINHLSGDDVFLLMKITRMFGPASFRFTSRKDTLVITKPLFNIFSFIQQRVRWASKWRLHRSGKHYMSVLLSYALAMIQLASFLLLFGNWGSRIIFILFWLSKIMMERKSLGMVLTHYKIYPNRSSFIISSFIHPLYLTVVGLWATFGKFTWKGRKNKDMF